MKEYRQHLIVCDDDDCRKNGGGSALLRAARKELGADARFTKCSKVSCLGLCKNGPVLIIYPDGVWYRCESEKTLKNIVKKHLRGGKIVRKKTLFTMLPPRAT